MLGQSLQLQRNHALSLMLLKGSELVVVVVVVAAAVVVDDSV